MRKNIFCRNLFTSTSKMESEDNLYYSHQKLLRLIQEKGDERTAIKEYLSNLNYESITDFPTGLGWFNVSESLSFKTHLKGKIVLLDFFTYCCINCMHIIPELREIEQEFSIEDGLVVIGVHSAKFENEKISTNILSAVQRYNITHPVVNDCNSDMWTKCDVHCWPTLLLLGPNANPIIMLMGEGHKENLRLYISAALKFYKEKKEILHHSLPFKSAYHLLPDIKGPLLFPGKISCFADDSGEIIGISDTSNHRILIIKSNGIILYEIGGTKAGFKNGNLLECEFDSPQGLVFKDRYTIFVADTENHAIRKINLENGIVDTVAGTGHQGNDRIGGKQWEDQEISSPWDVCLFKTPDMDMTFYENENKPLKDVLLIAMAGTHQIWALFLDETIWWKFKKYPAGTCICIAGSGREENRNNSYPQSAAFAQPSGLALAQKTKELYIADSESSSIRRLSLVDGKVTPVVGGDKNPKNLFAFGDKDGTLFEAKLQHSLGLTISNDEKTLFVADTYNHKLKIVDINQNSIRTLTDNCSFNEPAGLCINKQGDLYVADTNNHLIKFIKLDSNNTINNINLINLNSKNDKIKITNKSQLPTYETKFLTINSMGGKLILTCKLNYKNNLKLTLDTPQQWLIKLPDPTWSCVPTSGHDLKNFDIVISIPSKNDYNYIDIEFRLITCSQEKCLPKNFIVRGMINFDVSGPTCLNHQCIIDIGTDNININ